MTTQDQPRFILAADYIARERAREQDAEYVARLRAREEGA